MNHGHAHRGPTFKLKCPFYISFMCPLGPILLQTCANTHACTHTRTDTHTRAFFHTPHDLVNLVIIHRHAGIESTTCYNTCWRGAKALTMSAPCASRLPSPQRSTSASPLYGGRQQKDKPQTHQQDSIWGRGLTIMRLERGS